MTPVEEAKQLLKNLQVPYPFTFTETGNGDKYGLPGTVTGRLSASDGRAAIIPLMESASQIVAFPSTMELLTKAPELLAKLVEQAEMAQIPSKQAPAPVEVTN